MKKYLTLALILLVMGGFAQNKYITLKPDSLFNLKVEYSSIDTVSYRFYTDSEYFLMYNHFAYFMLAYEVVCYNDSTYVREHFMPKGENFCISDWECMMNHHWRNVWKHKQPTFQGFIKWLRKNFAPEPTDFTITVQDKEFSVDLKK